MEKNEPQISGFAAVKKAPSPWKKNFRKTVLPAYFCRYDLQNSVQKFFLDKWFQGYLSLVILRFRKFVHHNKTINKSRSTKGPENSAQRFDNYLTNHLVKFRQDRIKPWRVGALVITFFKEKKSLVRVF